MSFLSSGLASLASFAAPLAPVKVPSLSFAGVLDYSDPTAKRA